MPRSYCETVLADMLRQEYPMLTILNNDRMVLNGFELDIYIPALNMAIEWNGIHHYSPIYGKINLEVTKLRDQQKRQACLNRGISLFVIHDLVSNKKQIRHAYERICCELNGYL